MNKVPLASCSHQTSRVHRGSRETSGTSHWFQCSMFIFHVKFSWNYFFIYKQKNDRKKKSTEAKPEPNWSLTGATLEWHWRLQDNAGELRTLPSATALWRWRRWYQRQKHQSKDEEEEDHDEEDSQQHADGTPLTSICTHTKKPSAVVLQRDTSDQISANC